MKSILISIKPKHCANILNGLKTREIRKRFPKDYRGWVYIYCTKEKPRAILTDKGCVVANTLAVGGNSQYKSGYSLSGKVVARFYCDNVEETNYDHDEREEWYATKTLNDKELEKQSCLTYEELDNYLKGKGYAIHISKLEIFDTPKELSEFKSKKTFYKYDFNYDKRLKMSALKTLTKAPQNLMYIEIEDSTHI